MTNYTNIRCLKFNMMDEQGNTNYFKLDLAPAGDVYWILGDSGYYVSFHKSGESHLKNNYDKKFFEKLDFNEFFPSATDCTTSYFKNNIVSPEGRDVFAWPIPLEQLNTSTLIDKFYSIQGRKATITISDRGILN